MGPWHLGLVAVGLSKKELSLSSPSVGLGVHSAGSAGLARPASAYSWLK